MSDIKTKYDKLDPASRLQVNDFMDFLLDRQKTMPLTSLKEYKNKILNVSVWSESDLNIFEENNKLFNHWGVNKW